MADATGLPFFHFSHGGPFIFLPVRLERFIMAIFTAIHLGMKCMAEFSRGYWWRVVGQLRTAMAIAAFVDRKRLFAIMTSTAGLPFIHLSHRYGRVVSGFIQPAVTRGTILYLCKVLFVTERCRAGFFNLVDDIFHLMTFTAFMRIKGLFAVMTGAA